MKKILLMCIFVMGGAGFAQAEEMVTKEVNVSENAAAIAMTVHHDFGDTMMGTYKILKLKITAQGTVPTKVLGYSMNGPGFSVGNHCPYELQPMESCWMRVYFKPLDPGMYTGVMMMDFGDHGMATVHLTGHAM